MFVYLEVVSKSHRIGIKKQYFAANPSVTPIAAINPHDLSGAIVLNGMARAMRKSNSADKRFLIVVCI